MIEIPKTQKKQQQNLKKIKAPLIQYTCLSCHETFESRSLNRKYCSATCSKTHIQKNRIESANARWMNPTKRKKQKFFFGDFNKMSEWKKNQP